MICLLNSRFLNPFHKTETTFIKDTQFVYVSNFRENEEIQIQNEYQSNRQELTKYIRSNLIPFKLILNEQINQKCVVFQ